MNPTNLHEGAAALNQYWSQLTVGEANGNRFKIAKGIGSTNWHAHASEDEVFLVLRGSLTILLRTGDVVLGEGDLFIVPAGVEHCPTARENPVASEWVDRPRPLVIAPAEDRSHAALPAK